MNYTLMFLTTFLIQLIIAAEMCITGPLAPFLATYFSIEQNMVILLNLGYSAVGFFVPYLGVFADKYGKKKSLSISLALFILGSTLGAFSKNPYIFAFARIFLGFAYFSISATNLSYVSEFVDYKNRGKVSGLLRTAFGIAILFSPLLATYLVSKYNSLVIIYIPLAILGIFALISLATLPETEKSHKIKINNKEFLSLLQNPNVKKILATTFLMLTAPTIVLNYLSIYLSNNFNISQVNIGISYTIAAVGTVVGIVFSGIFADKLGKYKLSKIFFFIVLLSILPIPYLQSLPLLIGFVVLFSFGLDGGWTAYQALASEVIPEKRGTFMSLIYTVNAITITLYSLIGPFLYKFGGFKFVMTIATISVLIAIYITSSLKIKE